MDRETLRKVQLAQLEIAKEFKRICDENHIRYFMIAGTLLGSVRHGGFIPWDDDMDFALFREDYEKFLQIAPKALGDEYFIQTWDTDEEYPMWYAKLLKKNTVYREAVQNEAGSHHELFIDVFVYDEFPDGKWQQKWLMAKLRTLQYSLYMQCGLRPWARLPKGMHRNVSWLKYLPFRITAKLFSREWLKKKYNQVVTQYNGKHCQKVHNPTDIIHRVPVKCFENSVELPFEDCTFAAPAEYKTYLEHYFGDYMQLPPEEKRENRHQILELKL